jgi:hypothetical protein
MRRVWEHPDEAIAKAKRAKAEIEQRYAPKVVGEIARARLERLSDLRGANGAGKSVGRSQRVRAAVADVALQRVEQAMAFDLRQGVGPGGPSGFVRKRLMRLMLPFTHHEREVDRALLYAIRELRDDIKRPGSGSD